jgi:dihydroorotate dehydrogenase
MPDWSYQTVFRPILSRFRFPVARKIALGAMGTLGSASVGRWLIRLMGHMAPDSRLATRIAGVNCQSPVWVTCNLDRELVATSALTQFGIAVLELGPYGLSSFAIDHSYCKNIQSPYQSRYSDDQFDWQANEWTLGSTWRDWSSDADRLARVEASRCVLAARIQFDVEKLSASEILEKTINDCTKAVTKTVSIVVWDVRESTDPLILLEALKRIGTTPPDALRYKPDAQARKSTDKSLACAPLGCSVILCSSHQSNSIAIAIDSLGLTDVAIGISVRDVDSEIANQSVEFATQLLGLSRIVVLDKVHEPLDGIRWLAYGVSMVAIDSGLISSGPGLAKRIHAAELHRRMAMLDSSKRGDQDIHLEAANTIIPSWVWAFLLGVAMFGGGLLTMVIGAKGVLLPYDEAYLGMNSKELVSKAPRLLQFMAHDRVTLAGTMLAVGMSYMTLGWYGIRRGMHWSMMTIAWSTGFGFASFFLFLVFGYFDPLHAFVSAVLLQFTLQMLQSPIQLKAKERPTCIVNSIDWTMAQWGQLMLVIQACGLLGAGLAIGILGSTQVFVAEDLAYLAMTREQIMAINPRLVAVVAHDRATFGGMLMTSGAIVLFCAMWGFERRRAWLWWMLMLSGTTGYITTITVHNCVGYTDMLHLFPAGAGLIELWLALALSLPYLTINSLENESAWSGLVDPSLPRAQYSS